MPHSLARSELYRLVWSEPLRDIAERFGVSDVALRKACLKASIPTPKRGYWAKRNAGLKPSVTALSPAPPGMIDAVGLGYGNGVVRRQNILRGMPDQINEQNEPIDAARKRFAKVVGNVSAPDKSSRLHPAIARLLEADRRRAVFYTDRGKSVPPYEVHFGGAFERRRLRLLNALFQAVARLGGKSKTDIDTARRIVVSFDGTETGIGLDAPKAFDRKGPPAWTFSRYGSAEWTDPNVMRMAILDGGPAGSILRSWDDVESIALESRISEIAVELAVQAEEQARSYVAKRNRRVAGLDPAWEALKTHLREEELDREQQRVAKLDKERVDRLLDAAENMRKAKLLREFVDEIEQTATHDPDVSQARLVEWCLWVREQADRLDPAVNGAFLNLIIDPMDKVEGRVNLDELFARTRA